jgi:chromate transporter
VRLVLTWGALWVAPVLALAVLFGLDSIFLPIAGFFSTMAVVTFGGAYAVLAYVAQQAVAGYGWLNPGEMLDGLALAETTPGPADPRPHLRRFPRRVPIARRAGSARAAVVGATLTTWVTFVPCFLWIFLGAPYIERLRGNRTLAGALSAITAAVVGVILNLTIWFGLHVLFTEVGALALGPFRPAWPDVTTLDPLALALSLLAVVALFWLKLGMVKTLALCGLGGLLLRLVI